VNQERAQEQEDRPGSAGGKLAGLAGLMGGVCVGWRVWNSLWPAEAVDAWAHAQGEYAGTGIVVPLARVALLAFLAGVCAALVVVGVLKGLAACSRVFGKAVAEGYRQAKVDDEAKQAAKKRTEQ